jgi:hypothetical protein
VISNSYGAPNGAGLFLTSTPRSETTDMLEDVWMAGLEGVLFVDWVAEIEGCTGSEDERAREGAARCVYL